MTVVNDRKRQRYYDDPFALPPECDPLCLIRPCFNKYENKGNFSPGRGYTSYHKDFSPACGTRMCHGCPSFRNKENDELDVSKAVELLSMKPIPLKIKEILKKIVKDNQI